MDLLKWLDACYWFFLFHFHVLAPIPLLIRVSFFKDGNSPYMVKVVRAVKQLSNHFYRRWKGFSFIPLLSLLGSPIPLDALHKVKGASVISPYLWSQKLEATRMPSVPVLVCLFTNHWWVKHLDRVHTIG